MGCGSKSIMGTPILDELRLCYAAQPSSLEGLSAVEVGESITFSPFTLFRQEGVRYEFSFTVCLGEMGNREEVGLLRFGRYSGTDNEHAYYIVSNSVLYDKDRLKLVLSLPAKLGLTLNNFTAIDIAIDYPKNVVMIIKRMMRNKQITTILNGKAIKDRRERIKGLRFDYSTSLNQLLRCPTITLHQAKAIKNRNQGIVIQAYNKREEIEVSGKDYILDYYDNPRFLFRLEVRLPYQELKDYCAKEHLEQTIDLLGDPVFLRGAYFYHLSSVLRFTKGRQRLSWEEVIKCNGRF